MKLYYKSILVVSIIIVTLFSGCITDDNDNCMKGLNVSFYSKSSCQFDTTYIGQVNNLILCIFDKDEVLVTYRRSTDVNLNRDHAEKIDVSNGLYSVLAWTGVEESNYDVSDLQNGVTKKSDVLFRLKRVQNIASSINGAKVYYGESPAVYVEVTNSNSEYIDISVNLQEITNRFTITVEGLNENVEDYEINIESNNGSMNLDGSIAEDETITYESIILFESGILKSEFTILKLETGYNNTIVIKNKSTGIELYRESLLGTLLFKNPEVNLNCDHDFIIEFTAEDQCACGTYTIMKIWVNNWLVHSYDAEM